MMVFLFKTGFIAKINKNNNNCIWANALQGNQTWTPYSILMQMIVLFQL